MPSIPTYSPTDGEKKLGTRSDPLGKLGTRSDPLEGLDVDPFDLTL
jgi:hypothetical protein